MCKPLPVKSGSTPEFQLLAAEKARRVTPSWRCNALAIQDEHDVEVRAIETEAFVRVHNHNLQRKNPNA
jgi:hypothetical protein